ncbi:unnamed protein product, partial [Nesidiocoris tenuis]
MALKIYQRSGHFRICYPTKNYLRRKFNPEACVSSASYPAEATARKRKRTTTTTNATISAHRLRLKTTSAARTRRRNAPRFAGLARRRRGRFARRCRRDRRSRAIVNSHLTSNTNRASVPALAARKAVGNALR